MNILIHLLLVLLSHGQILSPILFGTQPAAAGNTAFVTSVTLGTLRNWVTDCQGFDFTVGASNITVTDLGRWVVSGNTGTHTLIIEDRATATAVVTGTVNTSGATAGQYLYTSVTPGVLTAGTIYEMFSSETNAGDYWYNDSDTTNTTINSTTAVATNNGSVHNNTCTGSPGTVSSPVAGLTFGPVNFKYHL